VVEDEPLLQMLLVGNLEELGLKAETAGSATEALNKLRRMSGGFEGAIVDLGLPDYGGEVLVREMRALHPALRVVISSGQGQGSLQDQFGAMGRVAILVKPYTSEELGSALQAAGIRTSTPSPG
jgi:DNA-binding response OmpR family regulator